jgi:flagellar biosynthesis protein FlhG
MDIGAEPPEVPADGEALRRERQRQNQSLGTISAITKVRPVHLQAIEEERFEDLPAEVYLRGFLHEYANCLGLAGDQVARLYLQRYHDWLRSHPPHGIP